MINSEEISHGQILKVDLQKLKDRLPTKLNNVLKENPYGKWLGGYKMVDGNNFALVLELVDGSNYWFFENELKVKEVDI